MMRFSKTLDFNLGKWETLMIETWQNYHEIAKSYE